MPRPPAPPVVSNPSPVTYTLTEKPGGNWISATTVAGTMSITAAASPGKRVLKPRPLTLPSPPMRERDQEAELPSPPMGERDQEAERGGARPFSSLSPVAGE